MAQSKNDPTKRGGKGKGKSHNGRDLKPVKYVGARIGHGNYIAAQYEDDGTMVVDANGKPIPWKDL